MATINELQDQVIEEFSDFDDWMDKYQLLIDLGNEQIPTFYQESYSLKYAQSVVNKVWNKANNLGYSSYFIPSEGEPVTDDHLPINRIAGIPCIDIIPYDQSGQSSGFGPTWHTVNDNMEHIDKNTLQIVGNTLIGVIYNEK